MIKTIIEAFRMRDTRRKLLFTLLCLLIYRLGAWIPVPGIDPRVFRDSIDGLGQGAADFLNLLSDIGGGALANGAILALGVGPYITSSIVMQLLTIAIPALERLSKQGDEGRRKIAVYTRYVALAMALAQGVAIAIMLATSGFLASNIFGADTHVVIVAALVALILTAGAMFTVWLGDKITEHGISNGMSLLIFVGIISTGAGALFRITFQLFEPGGFASLWHIPLIFLVTMVVIFFFIVFVDLAERRIPVTYAKQVKGNKMYGGQSANIPIKVYAVGVIPIIFAFSILNFPQLIMTIFWPTWDGVEWYARWLGTGTWLNISLTALLILGFSYFYASLSFNPEDVSRQIQQNGGFILGYRPGIPTRDYLRRVHNRITLFGAIFLMIIALVPSLAFRAVNMPIEAQNLINAFTSIGMLIIVSVALEIEKSLQAQMLMKSYKGFLK